MLKSYLRLVSVVAVVALAAMVLVACGSSAPAPAATTAPSAPKAAEPTKAPAAPAAATAAPAAATTAPAAAAKPAVTWPKMTVKLGHVGVTDMSYHKANVRFSEIVKERTGGAIDVQVFPNSQLGSEKDMQEQVKNNVIQIALTGPSMLGQFQGWGPVSVLSMPYLLKGKDEAELAPKLVKLARSPLMMEMAEKAAAESGIRALDMGWFYGERMLTTKTKQVVKPEDVKGLKIRTMDSPIAKAALNAMGAACTPMAVSELYSALQMGVVEGQENPINTIYSHKFQEVQKYIALTGHHTMNLMMTTNDKWFKSQPKEVQDLFVTAMREAGDFETTTQLKMNKDNLEDLKKAGMTVTEVNKADFAKATENAWKEFEPIFGKGFYEKVRDEASKY